MSTIGAFLQRIRDYVFGKDVPAKGFQPGEMKFDGIRLIAASEPPGWTMLRELVKAGAPIEVLRDTVLTGEVPKEGRHYRIAPGWDLVRHEDYSNTIKFKWRRAIP